MKLPETIYLTQGEDYEEWSPVMETLWCEDKLNDLDVSYIRADSQEDLQDKWSKSNSEATKWVEELKTLRAENAKLKSRIKELEGVK